MAISVFFLYSVVLIQLLVLIFNTDATTFPSSDQGTNTYEFRFSESLNETGRPQVTSEIVLPYGILGGINTFIGFASSIITIFSFFDSITQPPKSTADEVKNLLVSEFASVGEKLDAIKTQLTQQQLTAYSNVQESVNGAINDYKFQSTVDLASRGVVLYDRLDTFMQGMLVKPLLNYDLLETVRILNDCGSKSIFNDMDKLITLVNAGAVGISYYSKTINNKSIFNGNARIESLSLLKDAVLQRTQSIMNKCASMSPSQIDSYITKVLSRNQGGVETSSVSKQLYDRFADIYPSNVNWVFYTALNFNPVEITSNQDRSGSAYMMYTGSGAQGVTKNGDWTVYWVGNPTSPDSTAVPPRMFVNTYQMNPFLYGSLPQNHDAVRTPRFVLNGLRDDWITGRKPVSWFVFINPPEKATIGNPIGKLNVYNNRCLAPWRVLRWETGQDGVYLTRTMSPNTIDIIIQ